MKHLLLSVVLLSSTFVWADEFGRRGGGGSSLRAPPPQEDEEEDEESFTEFGLDSSLSMSMDMSSIFAMDGSDVDIRSSKSGKSGKSAKGQIVTETCFTAPMPFLYYPDLNYGSAFNNHTKETETLLLDAYFPGNAPPGDDLRTIAILVHGGDCASGSRREPRYIQLARYLAKNGLVALTISYRTTSYFDGTRIPSCRAPGSIQAAGSDVKAAIRWAKARATESKGTQLDWFADPSKIWLFGCSAGARAAAWATYVPGNGIQEDYGDALLGGKPIPTSKDDDAYDTKVSLLTMLSGELYVPHLNCDLYSCGSEGEGACIQPNPVYCEDLSICCERDACDPPTQPNPTLCNDPNVCSRCAYEFLFERECNDGLQRVNNCEQLFSEGDTTLTMIHNTLDGFPPRIGPFTAFVVALRLQDLAKRQGLPVDLYAIDGKDHCPHVSPIHLLEEIIAPHFNIKCPTVPTGFNLLGTKL